jgi:hypothetical protein
MLIIAIIAMPLRFRHAADSRYFFHYFAAMTAPLAIFAYFFDFS